MEAQSEVRVIPLEETQLDAGRADRGEPWHAIGADEALRRLAADRRGLTDAEVRELRERFGSNVLPEPPRRSALARLAAQFNNLLIYVLMAAGVVTALLGHWTDTSVIFGVILLNALVR